MNTNLNWEEVTSNTIAASQLSSRTKQKMIRSENTTKQSTLETTEYGRMSKVLRIGEEGLGSPVVNSPIFCDYTALTTELSGASLVSTSSTAAGSGISFILKTSS